MAATPDTAPAAALPMSLQKGCAAHPPAAAPAAEELLAIAAAAPVTTKPQQLVS